MNNIFNLFIFVEFCIFIIFSTFFKIFNLRYTYKLAANLEIELSKKIFKNNITQSYITYTQKNSSDLISITVDKVSASATAVCSFLNLTGGLILGLFIIISQFFINWQIISAATIFLMLYYLIIFKKVSSTVHNNGKQIASISPSLSLL